MFYSGGHAVTWAIGLCLFVNIELCISGDSNCDDGHSNQTVTISMNQTVTRFVNDWRKIKTKTCALDIICITKYRLQLFKRTVTEVIPYNVTKTECCPTYSMTDGICDKKEEGALQTSKDNQSKDTYIYILVVIIVILVIAGLVVIIVFKRRKDTRDRENNDGYELPKISNKKSKDKTPKSVTDKDKSPTNQGGQTSAEPNIYEDDNPYEEVSCYEDLLEPSPENVYDNMETPKS